MFSPLLGSTRSVFWLHAGGGVAFASEVHSGSPTNNSSSHFQEGSHICWQARGRFSRMAVTKVWHRTMTHACHVFFKRECMRHQVGFRRVVFLSAGSFKCQLVSVFSLPKKLLSESISERSLVSIRSFSFGLSPLYRRSI